uniref:Uncharacterized protein n=1 Tax=Leersia perrieri TaxID=77586 RepID=A0A0D9W629_9ORYZ
MRIARKADGKLVFTSDDCRDPSLEDCRVQMNRILEALLAVADIEIDQFIESGGGSLLQKEQDRQDLQMWCDRLLEELRRLKPQKMFCLWT